MKTFRLIGMALLAILGSMNFIACSSDDDEELIKNDDGIIINQKRLIQTKIVGDGESDISEYTYDNNGKLLSATETYLYSSGRKDIRTYTITWGANKIIENSDGRDRSSFACTFKNGLITHTSRSEGINLRNTAFIYNSNKQLIKLDSGEHGYTSYTWHGEKLAKRTSIYKHNSNDEVIYEFSYSGKTCKGYFPIMVWYVNDLCPLMIAHPELVGMRCNQLPDQICYKEKYYEEIAKYTYTFDNDGYIESCTEESFYKNFNETWTPYTRIFTFTWE